MSVLTFTVPGKPVGINDTHAGGFARVKTPQARAFNEVVAGYGMQARRRARWATYEGPVEVLIRVVFENERPDTDGPVKAVLDALQPTNPAQHRLGAAIVRNDRQVHRYLVVRDIDPKRPRVEVMVAPLGELFSLSTLLRLQHGAGSAQR